MLATMPIAKRTRAWIKGSSLNSNATGLSFAKENTPRDQSPDPVHHIRISQKGRSGSDPSSIHDGRGTMWLDPEREATTQQKLELMGISRSSTLLTEQISPPWGTDSTTDLNPAPLNLRTDKSPAPYPRASSAASNYPSRSRRSPTPPTTSASMPGGPLSLNPTHPLRRSQSAADIHTPSGPNAYTFQPGHSRSLSSSTMKALPPRPEEAAEETDTAVNSPESLDTDLALHSEKPRTRLSVFPPMTSPPPSIPIPKRPLERKRSKTEPPKPKPNATEATSPKRPSRFTAEERLWLHRHYRGEALFLKSWGLSIDKDKDRDEGMILMRELIRSETERRSSKKLVGKERSHVLTEKSGHTSPERNQGLPERNQGLLERSHALQVIEEEEKRSSLLPGDKDGSLGSFVWEQGQDIPSIASQGGLNDFPDPARGRSESEGSVLAAYLDARLSRLVQ